VSASSFIPSLLLDRWLLLDAVDQVQLFVSIFTNVYVLLVFVYVLTSWIRLPYSLSPIQRFLYDVCEPFLRMFRRILPPLGPLDLSPIVAVFTLFLIQRVVINLLERLH
jgi:YggT family protein